MSYSNLKLFSLSSNHELAQKVAKEIGIELGKVSVGAHSDGETVVHIDESVRGDHVFILQSTSDPVNDNLMELLIMMDALRRASAASINIVLPYYGYARQDRKARAREPITSKLVANMLQIAGSRILLEPRSNVNIRGIDKESVAIQDWMAADPESHFDRVKAKGSNFLVIPCLFSVDRVDM